MMVIDLKLLLHVPEVRAGGGIFADPLDVLVAALGQDCGWETHCDGVSWLWFLESWSGLPGVSVRGCQKVNRNQSDLLAVCGERKRMLGGWIWGLHIDPGDRRDVLNGCAVLSVRP